MPPAARALNAMEQKIHQACLTADKKVFYPLETFLNPSTDPETRQTISQKEVDTLVPDPNARVAAINFLLGTVCDTS